MVTVTVSQLFWDKEAKVNRRPGETFEATEERAAFIDAALPGYVTYEAIPEQKPEPKPKAPRRKAAPKAAPKE